MLRRDQLKPDPLNRLPLALVAVAVLLALWMLVRVVWLFAVPVVGEYPRLPAPVTAAQEAGFSGQWFGTGAAGSAEIVAQQSLPRARLDAQLLGVIAVGENAVANIAHGKNRDTVYRVGDTIANGITVTAIEAQRVVILEQGQQRQIDLAALGDKPGQAGSGKAPPVAPDVTDAAGTGATVAPTAGVAIGAGVSTVLLPDGSIGLQLDSAATQRLAAFGVEPGEFVTEADGVPIAELLADRSRWTALLERESVEVSLFRDGRSRSLSITPSAIAAQFLADGAAGQQ